MAIPKLYNEPILKDEHIKEGDKLIILEEFIQEHPILSKSFMGGKVKLSNGEQMLFSLNKTSYLKIAEVYGEDTVDWIDRIIVYKGKQPCGKSGTMIGKVFEAITE